MWMSLVTGLFFLVLLLNQRWSPLFRLQASHCSTFRIMCDVPSIAVFCSESIECFPGTVSKFFLKLLATIPVAPIITGTIVHFRFHIRCISIHTFLYLTLLLLLLLYFPVTLRPIPSHGVPFRGFANTPIGHTTLGSTPMNEWSAQSRHFYPTTHNTHSDKRPCFRTHNPR